LITSSAYVANPPCGVETCKSVYNFFLIPFLVANPPCGVETRLLAKISGGTSCGLLIHRVELKLVQHIRCASQGIVVANPPCGVETPLKLVISSVFSGLLIHRVELKLLAVGRLGFRLAPVVILAL